MVINHILRVPPPSPFFSLGELIGYGCCHDGVWWLKINVVPKKFVQIEQVLHRMIFKGTLKDDAEDYLPGNYTVLHVPWKKDCRLHR